MADELTVVVGAGLMGAASAWALARRGRPVVVLEQFVPDHDRGGSHGSARIIRRAYGDALYVGLAGRAFELWRELEESTKTPLLRILGGLDFGADRDVRAVAAHLAAANVGCEILPPAEAERRWPGMRFDTDVVFHPQAGTLDSAAAVRALLDDAQRHGAQVRFETPVVSIERSPGGAVLTTAAGERIAATQVVVAAGAWAGPLLGASGIAVPALTVTQEQVFHFPRRDPTQPPWPSVIHESAHPVYHLAGGLDGGSGDDRKIGHHDGGIATTAADRDGRVRDDARNRIVDYVQRWLPGLEPTPRTETTCLYTRTPSEDFVIDRVGPFIVCSPCSGHGAKFAPLVGEYVADLVEGIDSVPARFRLAAHAEGRRGSVSL